MRIIDADALREAVESHVTSVSVCATAEQARGRTDFKKLCLKDIDEAPTVGGWISVEDRLPETNDEVLTTYIVNGNKTKRFVEAASYCDDIDGEGFWTSPWDEYTLPGTRQEVIAWMPMPKPYKPTKEG